MELRRVSRGILAVLTALSILAGLAGCGGTEDPAPPGPDRPPAQGPAPPVDPPSGPPSDPAPALPAAESLLAEMTLREKVYQLFVVFPSDLTGEIVVTSAGEAARRSLEERPVGGLIFDKTNLVSQDQTRAMLASFQSYAGIPLLLTCDEEGGRVSRLMSTIGTTKIGPMLTYEGQGPEKAGENAQTIGQDLSSCGFNMDLAPVADVWSDPSNTVIGDRAYSTDFAAAARLIPAAVEGFHRGGVACTLKHFPGHGDTSADSHYGSVRVYKSLEDLRRQELLPFQAGIDAGADAVMVGHLIVEDVDGAPAPFSSALVTDLLRGEMGFDGVVVTDSLKMQAITDEYASGEAALRAVEAGVDLLLCPQDLEEAAHALISAVEDGTLPQERIDESVLRILSLKEARGIL